MARIASLEREAAELRTRCGRLENQAKALIAARFLASESPALALPLVAPTPPAPFTASADADDTKGSHYEPERVSAEATVARAVEILKRVAHPAMDPDAVLAHLMALLETVGTRAYLCRLCGQVGIIREFVKCHDGAETLCCVHCARAAEAQGKLLCRPACEPQVPIRTAEAAPQGQSYSRRASGRRKISSTPSPELLRRRLTARRSNVASAAGRASEEISGRATWGRMRRSGSVSSARRRRGSGGRHSARPTAVVNPRAKPQIFRSGAPGPTAGRAVSRGRPRAEPSPLRARRGAVAARSAEAAGGGAAAAARTRGTEAGRPGRRAR